MPHKIKKEQDEEQDDNQDGNRDVIHKCKYCEKLFSQARYLKKHIHRNHEGHKDYKCEPCGKSFSQSHALKGHIQTVHEGHKDHKCEFCRKSFSQAGTLKGDKVGFLTITDDQTILPLYGDQIELECWPDLKS